MFPDQKHLQIQLVKLSMTIWLGRSPIYLLTIVILAYNITENSVFYPIQKHFTIQSVVSPIYSQLQRYYISQEPDGVLWKYNRFSRLSVFSGNSTDADGVPRSRVCASVALRSAPHRYERKFFGTHFCRVTFNIFEKNLKKPKNRRQGAKGGVNFLLPKFLLFF